MRTGGRITRCGALTTWTIIHKDGPCHLGLRCNAVLEQHMALITLCALQMVAFMDEAVGNVTAALKRSGMWGKTLLIWQVESMFLS